MNGVVADEEQLKFFLDRGLRKRLDAVLEQQGLTLKIGMTRLIEFLLDAPEDLHPVVFNQVRGQTRDVVIESIVRRLAEHGPALSREDRAAVERVRQEAAQKARGGEDRRRKGA